MAMLRSGVPAMPMAVMAMLMAGSPGIAREDPDAVLTPRQYAELSRVLDGRVPGPPQRCISTRGQPSLRAVSDEILVYRDGARVFATRVQGRCSGLASGGVLVTRPIGGRMCRGDTARIADLRAGVTVGVCGLGDFIPYIRPEKAD